MTSDFNSAAASLSSEPGTPENHVPAKSSFGGQHPPLAHREPVEHVIHNDRRVDHYAWLRDKKDPRTLA